MMSEQQTQQLVQLTQGLSAEDKTALEFIVDGMSKEMGAEEALQFFVIKPKRIQAVLDNYHEKRGLMASGDSVGLEKLMHEEIAHLQKMDKDGVDVDA